MAVYSNTVIICNDLHTKKTMNFTYNKKQGSQQSGFTLDIQV